MRGDPRQDDARGDRDRARLPQPLQAVHGAGAAHGKARQRYQGHRLEDGARGRAPEAPERHRDRSRTDAGHGAHRDGYRCRRGAADAGAGDERRSRREVVGSPVEDHGPRTRASGAAQGRREDPLPRRRRAAPENHLGADLVRPRKREGLLQRRLHERARADPLAHAHRPTAALPGPSLDARVRRGLLFLSPAHRPARR